MDKLKQSITILLVSVFIFIALCFVFNKTILSHNAFGGNFRGLVEFFMPPHDFFTPLVTKQIDISQKGARIRCEYKNVYLGRHAIGLFIGNIFRDVFQKKTSMRLVLQVEVFLKNKKIFSKKTEGCISSFLGKNEGVILLFYDTPSDLPLNEPLTLEVEVLNQDAEIVGKYGPAELFVEKWPDL
jgi:hypothetical protein